MFASDKDASAFGSYPFIVQLTLGDCENLAGSMRHRLGIGCNDESPGEHESADREMMSVPSPAGARVKAPRLYFVKTVGPELGFKVALVFQCHIPLLFVDDPTATGKPGAGEGNRTLVCSLGSCRSAIELRPRRQIPSTGFSGPARHRRAPRPPGTPDFAQAAATPVSRAASLTQL